MLVELIHYTDEDSVGLVLVTPSQTEDLEVNEFKCHKLKDPIWKHILDRFCAKTKAELILDNKITLFSSLEFKAMLANIYS